MGSLSAVDVADVKILGFVVTDLRFPTSLDGVGSDAMHVGTNGSHPYIQLKTNHAGLVGEGIVSNYLQFPFAFKVGIPKLLCSPGIQQRPRQRTHLYGSRDLRETSCRQDDARTHAQHGQDMEIHGV